MAFLAHHSVVALALDGFQHGPLAAFLGTSSVPWWSAVTLVALIGTGVRFVQTVAIVRRQPQQQENWKVAQQESTLWLVNQRWTIFGGFLLWAAMVSFSWLDAIACALLAASLSFLGVARHLAKAGLLTRSVLAASSVTPLVLSLIFTGQGHDSIGVRQQGGAEWIPWILLLGILSGVSGASRKTSGGKLWLISFALLGLLTTLSIQLGPKPLDRAAVMKFLETSGQPADFRSQAAWSHYAAFVDHLQAAHVDVPPLGALRRGMRATMQQQLAADKFNSLYGIPMSDLGFLEAVDAPGLSAPYRREQILAGSTKTYRFQFDDLEARLLQLEGLITPKIAQALVTRIQAALPPRDQFQGLQDLLCAARTLERIGHPEAVATMRDAAHALLLATQAPSEDGSMLAFAPSASLVARDDQGQVVGARLTFVWIEATSQALLAMGRWGVPEGIDLTKLDGYLAENEIVYQHDPPSSYGILAMGARIQLESMPEFAQQMAAKPAPTPWAWFRRYRVLLTVCLLVASTTVVTWSTQPGRPKVA